MTRLDREARVTIKTLVSRGTTNTAVSRLMGVTEGSVSYHVSRMVTGAVDGRGVKPFKAAPQAEAIEHWRQSQQDGALNLAALHSWLVAEHGYDGSLAFSATSSWHRARCRPRRFAPASPVPLCGIVDRTCARRPLSTQAGTREWPLSAEQANVQSIRCKVAPVS